MSALLTAGGMSGLMPSAIQRAFAIDPEPGTTYLDAEHIVILMQENRSFDHTYGTLRGVRGYNDPRALTQPGGNPVWLQSSESGAVYAPFRFNLLGSKATWMGSLPHGWVDSAQARNGGRHNRWIPAKAATDPQYAHLPLTMGYYTREDLPFYYALADAFTVCDQNFCSSLTATEPNRLHMWTGTVRARQSIDCFAHVRNDDMGYDKPLDWMTYPDRLEQHGVSWRIYQNEISLPSGLSDDEDNWLSNFDDNPLEYFVQYKVRFARSHQRWLAQRAESLEATLNRLTSGGASRSAEAGEQIADLTQQLDRIRRDLAVFTDAAFAALPEHEQNLHRKAFTINDGDPDYRALAKLRYQDGGREREMLVPKGDVFWQFREDVRTGKLPTVSWIVAPEAFSDHPSSAWYGAWYVSEALDILTGDPEVWKKTIFILCYDENDGYFDHVPPFVPPQPGRSDTGRVSAGIDPSAEYVSAEQEDGIRKTEPDWQGRPGPIGLGFRVPLVIASPWSRGGYVCSQVFDHTSMLQFLEVFLSHRTGRLIRETNISAWRRTVCGDLTSAFRPWNAQKAALPEPVLRDPFLVSINEAQFMPLPNDMQALSAEQIEQIRTRQLHSPLLPNQESGVRPACALPYQLEADGWLSADGSAFEIRLAALRGIFGERAAGAPFRVYTPAKVRGTDSEAFEDGRSWDYAVAAGDRIADRFPLALFDANAYHLCVYGPNGFFRAFRGAGDDPHLAARLRNRATGAELTLVNRNAARSLAVTLEDQAYGMMPRHIHLASGASSSIALNLERSHGWYDLRLIVAGAPRYEQRYGGHVETGRESFSDPQMGTARVRYAERSAVADRSFFSVRVLE